LLESGFSSGAVSCRRRARSSGSTEFNALNDRSRSDRAGSPICSDEIEFSFLNGNLVVRRSRLPISIVQPGAAYLERVQVNTT
jgi:hypothetical protein